MRITTDRFDPLLRDLLTWNLVEADQTSEGTRWRLSERVQQRLEQIAAKPSRATHEIDYFTHPCDRCKDREITRLRNGEYVCDECWASAGGELPVRELRRAAPEVYVASEGRPEASVSPEEQADGYAEPEEYGARELVARYRLATRVSS